jgi:ABC-type Na+ efflux pump permease subunit
LLCASVVFLTLLGIATGKLARNNQEVHLLGALAVVILACLCGITPLPPRLSGVVAALSWNPVAHLNIVLNQAANVSTSTRAPESIFAVIALVGFIATAILRWTAGSTRRHKQEQKN